MQARHENFSQELQDLEKQLALIAEQNKVCKLKRDLRAAEYGSSQQPQVSLLHICHTVVSVTVLLVVLFFCFSV